ATGQNLELNTRTSLPTLATALVVTGVLALCLALCLALSGRLSFFELLCLTGALAAGVLALGLDAIGGCLE
ncbi:hypothetical protein T492DRAFT_855840, partial [Pavlovales sp. CCMP2436]